MDATISQVKNFFGEDNTAKFAKEWRDLTDTDKAQIKAGIGDGSLTY